MNPDRQPQLSASATPERAAAPPHRAGENWLDVEIRILERREEDFPVELTLNNEQVFHGELAGDLAAWVPTGNALADGQALFKALFASADLAKGWGAAQEKSPRRRVRLRLDPPELHGLPWELLHDGRALLAAQTDTPFSRYLPIDLPWGGAIADRPLRVLAAISNPSDIETQYDLPRADVAAEKQTLHEAIAGLAGKVQLDFVEEPVTPRRLEEKLRDGYHVLHVIAHGAYNARREQAAVYLQQEDERAQRVTDDEFTGILARLSAAPALIVIAACQSAQRSARDAYLGLGPKLVKAGTPAVVAMQDNVTLVTARQFSATLYAQLISHGAVDRAVNEARSTALTAGRPDAAIPVLFMRLKDGRLVSQPQAKPMRKRWALILTATLSVILLAFLAFSLSHRITPMGDGFNIAVAEFTEQQPDGGMQITANSKTLSDWLYSALQREAEQLPKSLKFETRGPDQIGSIEGADEAARAQRACEVARDHNATILIYGIITAAQDGSQVTPRFCVNDQSFGYGSEAAGPDRLGQAVPFAPPLSDPGTLQGVNAKLDARVSALQHLMKGLAYYYLGDNDNSLSEYNTALDNPGWSPAEGQEVLYLLKGAALLRLYDPRAPLDRRLAMLETAHDSFARAYEIDPDYSRSFLGLGDVILQQAILDTTRTDVEKLLEASSWYSRALESVDQPPTAHVPLKAAFGLGQAHLVGVVSHIPGWSLDQARSLFQHVIAAYDADPAPDLAALAAHAHCALGQAAGQTKDWKTMSTECRKAIEMLEALPGSPPKNWLARYWAQVGKAEENDQRAEAAKNAYAEAIRIGQNTAAGIAPDELAAWQAVLARLNQ